MNRLLFAILLAAALPLWGQTPLEQQLDKLIASLPEGSEVAVSIYDLTAKKPLYTYHPNRLSRPASTMKLATGIATLARTDMEVPFSTQVWYQGTVSNDTLHGNIYVVGGFDPEFDEEGMRRLVNSVLQQPFKVVTGKVYGDVSMKDSLYWGQGWAWDDTPEAYQPYLSPLMYSKGTVTVTVSPSDIQGQPASVYTYPSSTYYTIENNTRTKTPSAGRFDINRNWLDNGNHITVKGNVERRSGREINVFSSKDFFMHTFMDRLSAQGLQVDSIYEFAELIPDDTEVLLGSFETSAQRVLEEMMKESDNLYAEALLYRLGALTSNKKAISAQDGLKEITALLRRFGYKSEQFKVVDGSGLSNYNYLSPAMLVDLLKFAYNDTDMFRRLYKSLPISGIDGTLKHRMKQTVANRNVHAKTGSFTGINCLAGYTQTADGHDIAFAIMNQNVLQQLKAREFQNKVCEVICSYKYAESQ